MLLFSVRPASYLNPQRIESVKNNLPAIDAKKHVNNPVFQKPISETFQPLILETGTIKIFHIGKVHNCHLIY